MSNAAANTSYRISEFADPEAEMRRLRLQAEMIFAEEDAVLRKLGFPEHGKALEVGCGPGFVAQGVMRSRPAMKVVGVDIDRRSLMVARERVQVLQGSALALPFASNSFDLSYSRLLFRHVQTPARAAAELVRVTAVGGSVFAIDADDGQLVLDPMPEDFLLVQQARHASIRRRGCDACVARRIPGLFLDAGLVDVRAAGLALCSTTIGARDFARAVLFPVAEAIDPDLLSADVVERCRQSLEAWSNNPRAFGMIIATFVAGRKV